MIKTLSKKFNENKKITLIIGDGGGKILPRLNCYIKDNHRFIVSGIGDVVGDTILLLCQNKVFALPL